jgi:quinoprotein glucose dehydrogenase
VWGFQVVHHDLWDYDVASQPTLFIWADGRPALAVTTKMGRVFVLDRLTGVPLLPVEERPVPPSDIPRRRGLADTADRHLDRPRGPEALRRVGPHGRRARVVPGQDRVVMVRGDLHAPESLKGTIVFPGNAGGVNWGSSAYDPKRNLLIANLNHLAMWGSSYPERTWRRSTRLATRTA